MSNALFLIYFSIVNGVETLGEVYRGTRSPQGQWSQQCIGDRGRGCPAGPCAPPQERVLCECLLEETVSCVPLGPGTAGGLGSFRSSQGGWLLWHRTSGTTDGWHTLVSPGESFAGNRRARLQAWHTLPLSARIAFARLLRPTRGNRLVSSRLLLIERAFGVLVWGSVLCCLSVWQGKDTRMGRTTACRGWRVPAQGPGARTLITFYFNFCVLAILNCKTNRCLQYNTCIKNNNNKNKAWFCF